MRGARRLSTLGLAALLVAMSGCSALINPDTDSFGPGADSGAMDSGAMDSGAYDAGALDAAGSDGGDTTDGGNPDGSVAEDSGPGDGGPVCPPSCDDMIDCTVDMCVAGRCTHRPDDGACSGDDRCSATTGCVPNHCTVDGDCDNGIFCDGVERCDSAASGTGCVPGPPPTCADGYSCTEDTCSATSDACEFTPVHSRCSGAAACAEDVCDPASSSREDGCAALPDDGLCATDYCVVGRTCDPFDGCRGGSDRDCSDTTPCTVDSCSSGLSMCVHTPVDGDGDGFAAASVTPSAGGPTFMCAGGTDCDDSRDRVFPGAPELCNGRDDDCDTMVDEGCDTRPDTCATAREIVVGATGTTTVGGSFGGLHDDYQTSPICGAMSRGRDAVYYFDLPRGLFDVTIDTIGSDADTVLGVGFSCDAAGLQLACNDDIVDGDTNSRIWLHRVGSATSTTRVFVLVDAFRDSVTGDYLLNVSRRPAASDSCPAPIAGEPMDISGGGTVLGYNSRFFGAQRGNCAPATTPNPPEAVFSLTSSGGGMRFDVYSVDFSPIIYSRRTCDAFGSELGCSLPASAGGVSRATLEVPLAPGNLTYFFVDGGRGSYAAYYRPL